MCEPRWLSRAWRSPPCEELLVDLVRGGEGLYYGVLECFVHVVTEVVLGVQDEVAEFLHNKLHGGGSGFLNWVGRIFLEDCVADVIGRYALDASQLASWMPQPGAHGAGC